MNAKRFPIAFSFTNEKREFVQKVADLLAVKYGRKNILYDKYHEAIFSRADLGVYLPELYNKDTELIVVVLSKNYKRKRWTGLEWRAIHELISQGKDERVMLSRFDRAKVAGLYLAGYVELDNQLPEDIAELIIERLEDVRQNQNKKRSGRSRSVAGSARPPIVSVDFRKSALGELFANREIWKALLASFDEFRQVVAESSIKAPQTINAELILWIVQKSGRLRKLLIAARNANPAHFAEVAERLVEIKIHPDAAAPAHDILHIVPDFGPILAKLLVEEINCTDAWVASRPKAYSENLDASRGIDEQLFFATACLAPLSPSNTTGYPLFRFFHLLSEQVNDLLRDEIRTRIQQTMTKWTADSAEQTRQLDLIAVKKTTPIEVRNTRVVVELTRLENKRYRMVSWLIDAPQSEPMTSSEFTENELPGQLARIHKLAAAHSKPDVKVPIEFFVSKSSLYSDVDQQAVAVGPFRAPLGYEHPVSLRAIERQDRETMQRLEGRWPLTARGKCLVISNVEQAAECTDSHCCALKIEDLPTNVQTFFFGLDNCNSIACGVVTRPIKIDPNRDKTDILDALIYSGIPAMLLVRDVQASEGAMSHFNNLLADQPIRSVADRVFEFRRRACAQDCPQHLGYHLTLLWDDPKRPHPSYDPGNGLLSPHESAEVK